MAGVVSATSTISVKGGGVITVILLLGLELLQDLLDLPHLDPRLLLPFLELYLQDLPPLLEYLNEKGGQSTSLLLTSLFRVLLSCPSSK